MGAGVGRRLGDDERRLYARMMEVYAGFLTHTDAQVGRVLDFVDRLGESDNTIVMIMSDNGASAEGGPGGTFNELYFFNFVPESMEENLRRIDDLGTPRANNHYPWGWAWAGQHAAEAVQARHPRGRGLRSAGVLVAGPRSVPVPVADPSATSTCTPSTCCPTLLELDRHRRAGPRSTASRRRRFTG